MPHQNESVTRVSTDEQTTALQHDSLQSAGCTKIYEDIVGGGTHERPGLAAALAALSEGDILIVWRLDRLGRSLSHLLDVVETLRNRGVSLQSLTEAIDTATATGKLVYSIFGAGLKAAQHRGERIGRRPALTPSQRDLARRLVGDGQSPSYVARQLRVGRSTLYRALRREGRVG
ncbi:MAG: recombinase family protein [Candidatus Eremiobacteraeota bacterium]|nr:recombinase family protein [Candidatus Eremiobacteraeota bacterium]